MALLGPRLRAQIIKELLCILRDPRSRIVLIVPPLIQLLLFSFAATLDVRHVARSRSTTATAGAGRRSSLRTSRQRASCPASTR
jgi:hypothetical protein